jgi:hypothetical protein
MAAKAGVPIAKAFPPDQARAIREMRELLTPDEATTKELVQFASVVDRLIAKMTILSKEEMVDLHGLILRLVGAYQAERYRRSPEYVSLRTDQREPPPPPAETSRW